jgi:hypothetical protein
MRTRSLAQAGAVLGLVALLWGAQALWPGSAPEPTAPAPAQASAGALAEAYRSKRSGMMVEGRGTLARLLADELEGDRHQRFVVELDDGQTVLVAHNIDVAPRVPLERSDVGAPIEFRGQYQWNAQGGVLHWTHRDPAGSHPGGWLRFRGKTYE